jgi:6-phosphogluconolactonase
MKTRILTVAILASAYVLAWSANPGKRPGTSDCFIYISVNSEKKILIYRLDSKKEDLVYVGRQDLSGEPGSLCLDPSRNRIYAALRDLGSVATLEVDRKTGLTSHLSDTPVADNPVYISTDRKGKYLLFTSYSGNKTAVYNLERDGINKDPVQVMDARMNPHMIKTDPSGKFVFVPNKGGDVIQQFILLRNGILKPSEPDVMSVKQGTGPRHFTFHPALDVMYVVNELSCTILVFNFNSKEGTLTGPLQEISTKPDFLTIKNTCADIHITPDGRFLYASNRGHDSLAGYSVDPGSGELKLQGFFSTEKEPREFAIDPSGRFIIAAGESSGKIALYRIQEDGNLAPLKTYETGHWPVWVMAVKL